MSNPTTFQLFPQLPPEIRLQIWRLALTTRRFVQITYDASYERFTSKSFQPALLCVNHESRTVALDNLLFIPGCAQPHLRTLANVTPSPPIYFSAAHDIIYIISKDRSTLWNTVSNLPDAVRNSIQNLVILYTTQVQSIWRSLKNECQTLLDLTCLKELWIVQYLKPELNRPSGWVSQEMLELVEEEGSGREVAMMAWDQIQKARTKETCYQVDGSWIWKPVGRVVCWHGTRDESAAEECEKDKL